MLDVLLVVTPPKLRVFEYGQEHLGVGYLAAFLRERGMSVEIFDASLMALRPEQVAEFVSRRAARVVGLSVFETSAEVAAATVRLLRKAGVKAHVTLGGYFPTLAPEDMLRGCPGADSVVRGEGEQALYELAVAVKQGLDWRRIPNISYLEDGRLIENPVRPLIEDLESLPFAARDTLGLVLRQGGTGYVLTSRGCYANCAFCSINAFYRIAEGRKWRPLSPERVVDEIERLVKDYGLRKIMINDDNMIGPGKRGKERAYRIARDILRRDLRLSFETICRANDVDRELFLELKSAGLKKVYMGLEAMNQRSLDFYRKGLTVEMNRRALEVLDSIGIKAHINFIMFNPYTTLDELRTDVGFIRERLAQDPGFSSNALRAFNILTIDRGSALERALGGEPWMKRIGFHLRYQILDPGARKYHQFAGAISMLWNPIFWELTRIDRYLDATGAGEPESVTGAQWHRLATADISVMWDILELLDGGGVGRGDLERIIGGYYSVLEALRDKVESIKSRLPGYYSLPRFYVLEDDLGPLHYDINTASFVRLPAATAAALDALAGGGEEGLRSRLASKLGPGGAEEALAQLDELRNKGMFTFPRRPARLVPLEAALDVLYECLR